MSKKKQDKKKQEEEALLARFAEQHDKQLAEKWTKQITDPKPAVAPRREPKQKQYKWP